jgi:hypothetical protein
MCHQNIMGELCFQSAILIYFPNFHQIVLENSTPHCATKYQPRIIIENFITRDIAIQHYFRKFQARIIVIENFNCFKLKEQFDIVDFRSVSSKWVESQIITCTFPFVSQGLATTQCVHNFSTYKDPNLLIS